MTYDARLGPPSVIIATNREEVERGDADVHRRNLHVLPQLGLDDAQEHRRRLAPSRTAAS